MECPKCGARTGVYNGYSEFGKYIRRRKCTGCGYRFITVEQATSIKIQGDGKHGGARKAIPEDQYVGR